MVYFECVPVFFVTGNLYLPTNIQGKVPGVMLAHGHRKDARLYETPENTLHSQIADGDTRIALVVIDNIGISREVMDEAKRQVTEATGLPADRILMCCTHTHPSVRAGWPIPIIKSSFTMELANGSYGCLPTPEQHRLGG